MYLLCVSIMFASFNSILLHKVRLKNASTVFLFNFFCAIVWCLLLWTANGFQLHFNRTAMFWGILYGITQALFILFKTLAMNSGPVSVTTLVGNMSLVISVLFCFVIWGEVISKFDVVGLVLLLAGIFLATYEKTEETGKRRWIIYVTFFLIFAAGVGISFKGFSKSGDLEQAGDMMLIAAFVMALLYMLLTIVTKKQCGAQKDDKVTREFYLYAIFTGVLSCIYNRLNIYLSGNLDAVIFFPAFNGGVIFLSTIFSVIFLKERLRAKTIVGGGLGLIGICIIGIL